MISCRFISYATLAPYDDTLTLQYELQKKRQQGGIPDTVLLLEHTPVITLGRRTERADLLTPEEELSKMGIALRETDRGGEITAHNPGQLVAYPILDLREHGQDLHRYLRDLEEVLIETVAAFGVAATRKDGLTGIWAADEKIAAIGIKVSRWISMHGIALNIENDLTTFRRDFVPCGIAEYGVTSLSELLPGRSITRKDVEPVFIEAFCGVFHIQPDIERLVKV